MEDDGVGIEADVRKRIFAHGYSTKAHGHGFGLHSAANTAAQLGGTLAAHSDGEGHGARFILELPLPGEKRSTPPVPKLAA